MTIASAMLGCDHGVEIMKVQSRKLYGDSRGIVGHFATSQDQYGES